MPFSFAKLPALHFGPGKICLLPKLILQQGNRRVLLVTGARALQASGHLEQILDLLAQADIHVNHIVCAGEPSTQWVDNNCEVTKNAVISKVGDAGYKKSLRHDNLVPDLVLVDGELLVSCPPDVTVACGLDAFTQLVEPYLSPTATPLTDAIAWSGLEAFNAHFLNACNAGAADPQVREGMAYAALMSGISLANAGLGIVHGLASPLGGYFPIPHGVACGTLVAQSLKVNWQTLKKRAPDSPALTKMVRLGRLLSGTDGKTDDWYGQICGELVEQWTTQLAISRLGHYGIQEAHFDKVLDGARNRNNPIQLEREEIRSMLQTRL